jgi:hypothetical protein
VCVRQMVAIPQLWGSVRDTRRVKAAYSSSVLAAWRLFYVDRKAMPRLAVRSAAKLNQRDVFVGKLRTRRRIGTADGTTTDETRHRAQYCGLTSNSGSLVTLAARGLASSLISRSAAAWRPGSFS